MNIVYPEGMFLAVPITGSTIDTLAFFLGAANFIVVETSFAELLRVTNAKISFIIFVYPLLNIPSFLLE
jgi:hypothetical protein